jgi:gluconolactonase
MTTIRTRWERLDERFASVHGDRFVEVLFDQGRWLEGPAYSPLWRSVLFSDIPNDRVLQYDEITKSVGEWMAPSGFANGRIVDRRGRVVHCHHGSRSVTRVEPDGSVTTLADAADGHRLNSPNDLVERADGSIWFTDPSYGIRSDYEGHRGEVETGGCHVYRIDPDGTLTRVADDFAQPNGLAFSADERELYVVDSERNHVRRFDVAGDGALPGGEVLVSDARGYDGVRVDDGGRLWLAAGDGLHCVDRDGTLLGKLLLPEVCANLTFGGAQRNVLYITATNLLLSVRVSVRGASYPA